MYDVISVGSSTVDVFAKVESQMVKIKTPRHEDELIAYPHGSKILIKELQNLTGGGGTNCAVALARIGLKTAYLGKTGNDKNSTIILEKLEKEKVEFIGISVKGCSGYSIILDSLEGDRTILTYKGVNNELKYKEIDIKKLKTKWFYFSSMVGESYTTLEKLSEYAKKNKIKTVFNPSNYLAEKGPKFLSKILKRTDILILNKDEASLIAGDYSADLLVKKLERLGPKQVVVTDGENGAYTCDSKYLLHAIPNKVNGIQTTGAGDAFAATYLAGIILGKSTENSLKMALINAGSVITKIGAKGGLLNYKKIEERLKKNPPTILKKKY